MIISTYVSKENSLFLRGIAAIMMVVLHTFTPQTLTNCFNIIYIGDVPLWGFISKGCNPVSIYLFLAGYGLYYQYHTKKDTNKAKILKNINRCLKLYFSYWVSLLLFVIIIGVICTQKYTFNATEFIENFFAWKSSYNFATWFLFHYILLVLLSPWIFRYMEHFKMPFFIFINIVIYISACFILSSYNEILLNSHYSIYQLVLFLSKILPFSLGAIFMYYSDKRKDIKWCNKWTIIILLIATFIARCILTISITLPFTAAILILLIIHIDKPIWLKKIINICGIYSMEIWLVHSYYNKYLFANFIYSFKVPIIILLVIIIACICYGWVYKYIKKRLNTNL